jgi:hypothetical protein
MLTHRANLFLFLFQSAWWYGCFGKADYYSAAQTKAESPRSWCPVISVPRLKSPATVVTRPFAIEMMPTSLRLQVSGRSWPAYGFWYSKIAGG